MLVGRHAVHRLAVERPVPGVGLVEPGHQVEERRLAGAVGADQGGDRAALDLDPVDVDGGDAAEVAAHAGRREDRVGLVGAGLGDDTAECRLASRRSPT